MNRFVDYSIFLYFIMAVMASNASAQRAEFSYHGPGDMAPGTERGVADRRVFLPTIAFPLRVGASDGPDGTPAHAYSNSQIFNIPGNSTGYAYPWRDNYCESQRSWPMPACPRKKGHQGQDIRPSTKRNKFWEALAMEDGVVEKVTRNTTVQIRFDSDQATTCRYLHLSPVFVRVGDRVKKGVTVIGKVSNLMGGRPNTSIHLHFDCKTTHPDLQRKVHIPIYTSLVAAYRREWGLPDMTHDGVLLSDAEREVKPGSIACPQRTPPLAATKDKVFLSRWMHNCSEMGLTANGNNLEMVYVRPKLKLASAAQRNPVLLSGTKQADGKFAWKARHFNKRCNDPTFDINGEFNGDAKTNILVGSRAVLNTSCAAVRSVNETLTFARLEIGDDGATTDETEAPVVDPGDGLTCPFDAHTAKSERSCNFLAITVPGGLQFSQMPRYIQEWPGVREDVLIDKNSDQIITLRTAEGGVGMWWYWIMNRARHGTKKGFGPTGTPTLAQLARAMAGKQASDTFVTDTYTKPYLSFAKRYFGRTIGRNEPIDVADTEARWNLARTMFRLESGNEPLISRKQFDCGIEFGSDVHTDFTAASVESSASGPITLAVFKGLEHYTNVCSGGDTGPVTPIDENQTIAELTQKLAEARLANVKLQAQLNAANERTRRLGVSISDLAKQLEALGSEL